MQQPLIPRRLILALIGAAVFLPIALCIIFGVAFLLGGMGDATGAAVLHRIALAGGIFWVVDLIGLILVMAVGAISGPDEPHGL